MNEQGRLSTLSIPLSLLEYEEDYEFTGTFLSKEDSINIVNLKCNNGASFDAPAMDVTVDDVEDASSPITVTLTLSDAEVTYWDEIDPSIKWTYSTNATAPNDDLEA